MPIGIPYGLLIKLALLVALVGGIFFAGAHWKQKQWDAAIVEQSVKIAHVIVAVAQETAKIAERHARETIKTAARHEAARKEIEVHADEARSVRISPALERVFDDISGVRARPDGLPTPAGHPAGPAGAQETGPTVLALLRAYEHAVAELESLWDDYDALVQVIVRTDAIQREGSGN